MNSEFFLTALSNRFLEAAEAWKDLGRQPTHSETDMVDLAGHCESLINEANKQGYLASVARCLTEATDWNEAEAKSNGDSFAFHFFGGDFFTLAGYTTPVEAKGPDIYDSEEERFVSTKMNALRSGVIDQLVPGVFRTIDENDIGEDFPASWLLGSMKLRKLVFGEYALVCTMLSKMLFTDPRVMPATPSPKPNRTGKKRGPKSGQSLPSKCEDRIFELGSQGMDAPEIYLTVCQEFAESARVRYKARGHSFNNPKAIKSEKCVEDALKAMVEQAKRDGKTS